MSPVSLGHHDSISSEREMHELNQEADLLDQKMALVSSGVNGVKLERHNSDPEAQAMVIDSLRSQVQDLFSQVSQLNNKLVRSYDRVSDLEDQLHIASDSLRTTTLKVSHLEFERAQHLSALSTGLLVEKSHVTSELTRLMEKATEEAARRGQAESAQAEIEQELDELSAGLFDQANNMVVEARLAQARSERKAEDTEQALRSAEEIVGVLQAQMQTLQEEKEAADRAVEEIRITMGKGKWVDRVHGSSRLQRVPRLLGDHAPYREFVGFVTHLRSIRPSTPQLPAMSTLLGQPFLARLVTEDSDPTVRLDLAPSLNWLSRRTVIAAIHNGQLTVEPMATPTLLEELAAHHTIPGGTSHTHVTCALCGVSVLNPPASALSTSSSATASQFSSRPALQGSWSSSLFKTTLVQSISANSASPFATPPPSQRQIAPQPPVQVYIFRLDTASSSGLPSLPLGSQQQGNQIRQSTIYPLCTSNWCLTRLRTTCSLWAFVRTSIVEKVWEEESHSATQTPSRGILNGVQNGLLNGITDSDKGSSSPRRTPRMGISSIWDSMSRSISAPREPEKELPKPVEKVVERRLPPKLPPKSVARRSLLLPPPVHPASPRASTFAAGAAAPPLPARNRDRAAHVQSRSVSSDNVHEATEPISEQQEETNPESETVEEETTVDDTEGDGQPEVSDVEKPVEQPSSETLTVSLPSPLSRNVSHDSFETPTEEFHSLAASHDDAPTTISLPDSPPPDADAEGSHEPLEPQTSNSEEASNTPTLSTPVADKAPLPPTVSTTSSAPEEKPPSSPPAPPVLPRRVHPVVSDDAKPPSRPGSPAAPPIPRRARPVSTIDLSKPSSRPGSPAVPPRRVHVAVPVETVAASAEDVVSSSPHEETIVEEGAVQETTVVESTKDSSDVVERPAEPVSTEQPGEAGGNEEEQQQQPAEPAETQQHEAPQEAPAPDAHVPPPLPRRAAPVSRPSTEEPGSASLSPSPVPPPLPRRSATRRTQSVALADVSTAPESDHEEDSAEVGSDDENHYAESSTDVPQVNGLSDVDVSSDEAGSVAGPEEEDEDEPGTYVGDGTWEERTWKELVRLREEMFWARIGGRR